MHHIHLPLEQATSADSADQLSPDFTRVPHPEHPDEEFLEHVVFPELSPAVTHEGAEPEAFTAIIAGRCYRVHITLNDWTSPSELDHAFIDLYETSEPAPTVIPLASSASEQWPAGPVYYSGNAVVRIGGQPTFLQNIVTPQRNGRAFRLLACLETGWGDAGNINIFVLLDDNGIPTAACLDASCC